MVMMSTLCSFVISFNSSIFFEIPSMLNCNMFIEDVMCLLFVCVVGVVDVLFLGFVGFVFVFVFNVLGLAFCALLVCGFEVVLGCDCDGGMGGVVCSAGVVGF